jgi:hypothetical protein
MEHGHGFTHRPPIRIRYACLATTILDWARVASGRGCGVKNVLNGRQRPFVDHDAVALCKGTKLHPQAKSGTHEYRRGWLFRSGVM